MVSWGQAKFDQVRWILVVSIKSNLARSGRWWSIWGLVKMGQDTWILADLVYRRDGSEADMYNFRKDKIKHTLQTCTFLHYYMFMSRK